MMDATKIHSFAKRTVPFVYFSIIIRNFATMNKRICMGLLMVTILMSCATQQERAERAAQRQIAIKEAIEKRLWCIDITSMHTMRYGMKAVTPDFYLELRNDTLRSYLPYLGQAYQTPMMSPSQGLNFEEPVLRYQQSKKKEHQYEILINVKTKEDAYVYWIDIYDSGEASIRVRSNNRDPISFDGHISVSLQSLAVR